MRPRSPARKEACVLLLVAAVGVACASVSVGTTPASPSAGSPRTSCEKAWDDFAAIDDFHDSYRAATPTLFACRSVEEWIAVGRATPGHSMRSARVTAIGICRYEEEEVRSAPVCRSL
jgi:hypothetical protein